MYTITTIPTGVRIDGFSYLSGSVLKINSFSVKNLILVTELNSGFHAINLSHISELNINGVIYTNIENCVSALEIAFANTNTEAAGISSASWGGITGDLNAQTDLQNALNLKANAKLQNINEIYVDYTLGDDGNGLGTFDNPIKTLQKALDVVNLADSVIYVNSNIGNSERTLDIQINRNFNNLAIKGVANSILFNSQTEEGICLYQNIILQNNITANISFENIVVKNFNCDAVNSSFLFKNVKIEDSFNAKANNVTLIFDDVNYVGSTISLTNGTATLAGLMIVNVNSFPGLGGYIESSSAWVVNKSLSTLISDGLISKELYAKIINANSLFVMSDSDVDTLLPPGNLGIITDPFTGLPVPNAINLDPNFVNATSYLRVETKDIDNNTINGTLFLPDYLNLLGDVNEWANKTLIKVTNHVSSSYNLNVITSGIFEGARIKIKKIDGTLADSINNILPNEIITLRWSYSRKRFEEQ
jgi:hypothetical protein